MASVTLELESVKKNSLIQLKMHAGKDQNLIHSKALKYNKLQRKTTLFTLHKIASSFILFDWEFFSNELEYE